MCACLSASARAGCNQKDFPRWLQSGAASDGCKRRWLRTNGTDNKQIENDVRGYKSTAVFY